MNRTIKFKTALLVLASAMALCACAGFPTEPTQMALPGKGKSYEAFKADDRVCRQDAAQPGGPPNPSGPTKSLSQRDYDRVYVQCMYGKGHRVALEPPAPSYGYVPADYSAVPSGYAPAYQPAPMYPSEWQSEWQSEWIEQ